jgi:hypothetical protein
LDYTETRSELTSFGDTFKKSGTDGVDYMRAVILMIAFAVWSLTPAFAQKAEIEAVNAKWTEFFNKGISTASHRFIPMTRPPSRPAPPW